MNKELADKAAELKYTGKTKVFEQEIIKKEAEGVALYIIQSETHVVRLTPEEAVEESARTQKHGNWLKKATMKAMIGTGRAFVKAGTALETKAAR